MAYLKMYGGRIVVRYDGKTILPTDDIQTWLKCGGIKNKSYTTLSQVLADTTTLLALINNNNASDYLVRSTTWASGITADSTAMTDIGANNYCAETLLADSTWRTAICNSAYFESVLNTKVPLMTSNTTPSGECFSNSVESNIYVAYKCFDGNLSLNDRWSSGKNVLAYIGYKFTGQIRLFKTQYLVRGSGSVDVGMDYTAVIEVSNDNTNWKTISSLSKLASALAQWQNENIYDADSWQYIRLRFTSYPYNNGSTPVLYYCGMNELQFYGRTDV